MKSLVLFMMFLFSSPQLLGQTFKKVLQIPTDSINIPLYIDGMKPTKDGGFLLAGTQRTRVGNPAGVYIVKVSSHNHIQWSKSFSKPEKDGSNNLAYRDIAVQTSGDILILSQKKEIIKNRTHSINLVTKITSKGRVVWTKKIEGGKQTELTKVLSLPNDSFALFGTIEYLSPIHALHDQGCLVTCKQDGKIQWAKIYGSYKSANNGKSIGTSIYSTSSDNFIFTILTKLYGPTGVIGENLFIVKTDKIGNIEWKKEAVNSYGQKLTKGINPKEWLLIDTLKHKLISFQEDSTINFGRKFQNIDNVLVNTTYQTNKPSRLFLSFKTTLPNNHKKKHIAFLELDYQYHYSLRGN